MTFVTNSSQWTLLDIVNQILNSTDSEKVSSIFDTVESEQVVEVIKGVYFGLVSNRNWPLHKTTFKLGSFGNSDYPTTLILPKSVKELTTLNYNVAKLDATRKEYVPVTYMQPDEFLAYTNASVGSQYSREVEDITGVTLFVGTNKSPSYYTSFDDNHIVFDSYDEEIGQTVIADRTQCIGYTMPTFTVEDSWVPDLPEDAMVYLIEDSKSTASLVLRQIVDQKAEDKARRQKNWLSRSSWRVNGDVQIANYGRRSGRHIQYRLPRV